MHCLRLLIIWTVAFLLACRPTDPDTLAAVIAEMKTLGEDESAELLAGLVEQRDYARDAVEEVRGWASHALTRRSCPCACAWQGPENRTLGKSKDTRLVHGSCNAHYAALLPARIASHSVRASLHSLHAGPHAAKCQPH